MDKITYYEVLQRASSFLKENGKEVAAAEYLLSGRQGWSKTDMINQLKKDSSEEVRAQFTKDLQRFVLDEPAQYILGQAEFCDLVLKVTPATLIPRPETEELVALCLKHHSNDERLSVVDIGTGTGAIALSLKKARPNWQITAIDISADAVTVARENSRRLGLSVDFVQGDLLAPYQNKEADIVISNPPYIGKDEWKDMDTSVRKYEPSLALFANHSGYEIYERLSQEVVHVIKKNGEIYLEIGYRQGEKVKEIFQKEFPNKQVAIYKDLSGLDRMIRVWG